MLEIKKKKTETGQQFTYQMNEIKNGGAKGCRGSGRRVGGQLGGIILIMQRLLNDEAHVQSVTKRGE